MILLIMKSEYYRVCLKIWENLHLTIQNKFPLASERIYIYIYIYCVCVEILYMETSSVYQMAQMFTLVFQRTTPER